MAVNGAGSVSGPEGQQGFQGQAGFQPGGVTCKSLQYRRVAGMGLRKSLGSMLTTPDVALLSVV